MDERWFVFAAGIGFDAAVVGAVEKRRSKGKKSTPTLYARVGVREFLRADRRHPRLHVELPDGTRYDDIYFVIVTNTDPWTYVCNRPLRPTPGTDFDTGLGDLRPPADGHCPGCCSAWPGCPGNRPRIGRRGAFVHHDLESLTVIADEPMPVQVDGDYLELRTRWCSAPLSGPSASWSERRRGWATPEPDSYRSGVVGDRRATEFRVPCTRGFCGTPCRALASATLRRTSFHQDADIRRTAPGMRVRCIALGENG